MNLKKVIGKRIEGKTYSAVAKVMKRNFIGIGKKYDRDDVWELVNQINKAIDDRDKNYTKLTEQLKAKTKLVDEQKREGWICKHPDCSKKAVHVQIDDQNHIVYCNKHYELYRKLRKRGKHAKGKEEEKEQKGQGKV